MFAVVRWWEPGWAKVAPTAAKVLYTMRAMVALQTVTHAMERPKALERSDQV